MPTDREFASGALLVAFILLASWMDRTLPRSLAGVARAFLSPKIAIPFALFAAYTAGLVVGANRLGWWSSTLATDTVLWYFTAGSPLLINLRATSEPTYFRRTALKTVGVGALLLFYLNLVTFSFVAELILQFVLFCVSVTVVFAGHDNKTRAVKRLAQVVLVGIALWLIVTTLGDLSARWGTIDKTDLARSFALPVWLTVGALPFVFVFSLVANYELAAMRMSVGPDNKRTSWRVKLALLAGFRLSNRDLREYGGWRAFDFAKIISIREGVQLVREFRETLRAAERAKRTELDSLRKYAGVKGTNAEGRQLDRREFKETQEALEHLSSCQMGWHRERGEGYRPEMLETQNNDFTRFGLPREHGIMLLVSKNRRAWYAWRRTPSGWCFGIGSAKEPWDQWFFDGPDPPKGPPGKSPGWRSSFDDPSPDWD